MEMYQKNKDNRGNVKYHQTTRSRAYMVHVENLGDKYNEKNLMYLICSSSSTTAREKNATPLLYRRLLLKWKTSCLQQQKMKNLSLRLRLLVMCLLRTPKRINSCRIRGSRMSGLDPVSGTLRQN